MTEPTEPATQPSVLVVDDEAPLRLLLTHALRPAGFTVVPASSGEEAIEVLRAQQDINLALVDLHLPGMDGLATIRALRQVKPSLRCCLMSGSGSPDEQEVRDAGAEGMISKPFAVGEVIKAVRELTS